MPTELTAQNGAIIHQTTKISVTGCAKIKTLTRAQKLAAALKTCRGKHNKKKRADCEAVAHRQYGPTHRAKAKKRAKK
jgi:hypothetical protein